ncbi:Conserved hypothetical protein [Candidatus Hamiltonella defensa (Bemisia tabaci)]|nr:Conserved hypothetical protein [Candidatus Hamiltonella defensa (Bemisia tabaci)]
MVAIAQLVEPWIVIPVVVGSSPISHPIIIHAKCDGGGIGRRAGFRC